MIDADDRPTLAERYARAIESTHLEALPDERCPVDMLIAAGWCQETLGTALYRLRSEFDSVRSTLRRGAADLAAAQRDYHALMMAAEHEEAKAWAGPTQAAWFRRQAAALRDRFSSIAVTSAALSQLKSLPDARAALTRFAELQASQQRLDDSTAVRAIAAAALDAWLDPLCQRCEGRGFNGGFGSPMVLCSHCGGTKLRAVRLGPDERRHQFGRFLLAQMDRMTDVVTGKMRRFLSTKDTR